MNPVFYEEKGCILEANATRINTNNQKHTSCNPAEAIHNDNFGLKCGIEERKSKINITRKGIFELSRDKEKEHDPLFSGQDSAFVLNKVSQ